MLLGALWEFKLKKFNLAIESYERSLEIARSTGNKSEEGQHLNMIGNYYWSRGDLRTAQKYYADAVSTIQRTGYKVELAKYLYNSGLIRCWQVNKDRMGNLMDQQWQLKPEKWRTTPIAND